MIGAESMERPPETLRQPEEESRLVTMVRATPMHQGHPVYLYSTRAPLWQNWSEVKARMDELTARSGADEIMFEYYNEHSSLSGADIT